MSNTLFKLANIDRDPKAIKYLSPIKIICQDNKLDIYIDYSLLFSLSEYFRVFIYKNDDSFIDLSEYPSISVYEIFDLLHEYKFNIKNNKIDGCKFSILNKLLIDTSLYLSTYDIVSLAKNNDSYVLQYYSIPEFHAGEQAFNNRKDIINDECIKFYKIIYNLRDNIDNDLLTALKWKYYQILEFIIQKSGNKYLYILYNNLDSDILSVILSSEKISHNEVKYELIKKLKQLGKYDLLIDVSKKVDVYKYLYDYNYHLDQEIVSKILDINKDIIDWNKLMNLSIDYPLEYAFIYMYERNIALDKIDWEKVKYRYNHDSSWDQEYGFFGKYLKSN